VLGSYPAAVHCEGLVREGSGMEAPVESIHGKLKAGSVMPNAKFSRSRVCFVSIPYFSVFRPWVVEISA